MNISIDIEKMRRKLYDRGIEFDSNFNDYYLETKHINRFLQLAEFMNAKELKLNSEILSRLYRADVVCRQEMLKVLFPIELKITTRLIYLLEGNNVNLENFWDAELWLNPKEVYLKSNSYKKWLIANEEFAMKSVSEVKEKWNPRNIYELLTQFSFGQIASLIKKLKPEYRIHVLELDNDNDSIGIDSIVNIRNYIAHLGILFINGPIRVSPHKNFKLSEFLEKIDKLASGNFQRDFSKSINDYAERSINKIQDHELKEDIKKMFEVIKVSLNCV